MHRLNASAHHDRAKAGEMRATSLLRQNTRTDLIGCRVNPEGPTVKGVGASGTVQARLQKQARRSVGIVFA